MAVQFADAFLDRQIQWEISFQQELVNGWSPWSLDSDPGMKVPLAHLCTHAHKYELRSKPLFCLFWLKCGSVFLRETLETCRDWSAPFIYTFRYFPSFGSEWQGYMRPSTKYSNRGKYVRCTGCQRKEIKMSSGGPFYFFRIWISFGVLVSRTCSSDSQCDNRLTNPYKGAGTFHSASQSKEGSVSFGTSQHPIFMKLLPDHLWH